MKFGKSVLSPSYTRSPDFISHKTGEKFYNSACVNCNQTISIEFDSLIRQSYSWQDALGEKLVAETKEFYRIGVVGKSQDGGFPSMIIIECKSCKTDYLIYAGVEEISNSVYVVTMQGITEILEKPEIKENDLC